MTHFRGHGSDLAGYRPEEALDAGAGGKIEKTEAEEIKSLLAYLQGVVPALKQAGLVELVPYFIKFAGQLMALGL